MNLSLMNPNVLVGLFLGGMLPFLFCSMTMRAVGRAAGKIVIEVRRQFKEIAALWKARPSRIMRAVLILLLLQRKKK